MNPDKISTLTNGILCLSQALGTPVLEIIEQLEDCGLIDEFEAADVIAFTGG